MTDVSMAAGRFAQGEFRIGRVLSRSWSVLSHNFLKFSVVAGIAALPSLFIPQASAIDPGNPFQSARLPLIAGALMLVLTMLSQAILFHGAFQDMRRKPVSLANGLKVGLGRFFPLVGLVVVFGLAVLALFLILFFLIRLVPGLVYVSPLVLIPLTMLFLMWSMGTQARVVERLGPLRSLSRSRELTKGHRWEILGLLLVTLLVALIVGLLVGVAMGVLGVVGPGGIDTATRVMGLIWNAIWTAYFAVVFVVAYHDLRVAKEGVDTEQIAALFQ